MDGSGDTLYGTAYNGGSSGYGTVFKVNTNGAGFTTLHSFTAAFTNAAGAYTNSDGANPEAGLIISGSTLYGTAEHGGSSGYGAVFKVNTDGTGFTTLHSFAASHTNNDGAYTNSEGTHPIEFAGLILSGSTLFGSANYGGSSGNGTVFVLSTNGTAFTTLHNFTATDPVTGFNNDGANPFAGLVLSENTLYGTAESGGSSGNGTVFSLSLGQSACRD